LGPIFTLGKGKGSICAHDDEGPHKWEKIIVKIERHEKELQKNERRRRHKKLLEKRVQSKKLTSMGLLMGPQMEKHYLMR
jgi:hypothetical protein